MFHHCDVSESLMLSRESESNVIGGAAYDSLVAVGKVKPGHTIVEHRHSRCSSQSYQGLLYFIFISSGTIIFLMLNTD